MVVMVEIGGKMNFLDVGGDKVTQSEIPDFVLFPKGGTYVCLNKTKIIGFFPDAQTAVAAIALGHITDDELEQRLASQMETKKV